ncbi:MAG: FliA/WhiG family RNA polymerase sigma factor [Dehalococcoidia bacterium]|nr:FliA/WhiG family RNA polymerase sigma factor [Dehalococcoidia bacterium]
MLPPDNANEMWVQYKATGDLDLRQRLILMYAPLVKYVVGRMAIGLPGLLDSEDIISHATIGLIEAVERFDPGRGLKFETYAIARIRGSVVDVMRRLGNHARGNRRKMDEIEAAVSALEELNGRTPFDVEVAAHLGISIEEYNRNLLDASLVVVPLDTALRSSDEDDSFTLSDIIEDVKSPSPSIEAERSEMRAALLSALKELPERDRQIIALYYHEEMTLKEISKVFGISESRVCQLHGKAIFLLKRTLCRVGMLAGVGV